MKILQITTGMQKASGVTSFVANLVAELKARNVETEVVMTATGFAPCDVVHIHGLWSPLLHRASKWARENGIPVVWSTHGMSAPWSMWHKWWKKLPAWWLYQKWDLKRAAAIHCTTDLEVEWNRKLGFKNCFVAPLGTNEALTQRHRDTERLEGCRDCLKVLFVGRIYPVKGLENLVRAAALIKRSNNRTMLFRIVGPDQAGHQAALMKLAEELGVSDLFEWPGPKFGEELSAEYGSCDLLILPSFTENFGGVVIDALAHGKPVIASKFTPWKVLEDEHCGWWVDNKPESLAVALSALVDAENSTFQNIRTLLREMGLRGRKLVEERYTWSAVCDKMVRGYEEALLK